MADIYARRVDAESSTMAKGIFRWAAGRGRRGSSDVKVDGTNILVTGASSGIGAALAPMLAERGATVGIVARRKERLEEVLEQCRAHAPESRLWAADLGDLDAAERIADEAWDAFGGVDCLVNNAAIPKRTPVQRLTTEEVDTVMRINFTSPIRMAMRLLPRWLERDSGCVVNVSSHGRSHRHRARGRVLRVEVRDVPAGASRPPSISTAPASR